MVRALGIVLVLLGITLSTSAVAAKPVTAILLVARAELPDPGFRDSVVLVMNHIGPAPVGFIVNKPTRIPVSQLFPEIERLAGMDDKLHFGGPVEIASVSFLFRAAKAPPSAIEVLDGVFLSTNRELLRELLERERPMEGLRILVGYAGWAPGQLEDEIARGDWTLAPADASTIFDSPAPERLRPGAGRRASFEDRSLGTARPGRATARPRFTALRPAAQEAI